MEAYISAEAISNLNSEIYEYKELIEEQLKKIFNEFDYLNWNTPRGNEFQSNQLESLKDEIANIMFIIDDEISPYLNELYEKVNNL